VEGHSAIRRVGRTRKNAGAGVVVVKIDDDGLALILGAARHHAFALGAASRGTRPITDADVGRSGRLDGATSRLASGRIPALDQEQAGSQVVFH